MANWIEKDPRFFAITILHCRVGGRRPPLPEILLNKRAEASLTHAQGLQQFGGAKSELEQI